MSAFEANLREITKQSPELAAALRVAQGGRLEIRPTKSGHPTGFAQGRAIHSTYDPVKESTSWAAAQIVPCREGDVVLVFGIGLLYHVEALCKLLPPSIRIVVAVPDLVELHDACAVRIWGDWARRVTWVWGVPHSMAKRTRELGSSVRLMTYVPAARLHSDAHAAIEESLRRSIAHAVGGQLRIAVVGPIYGGSLPVTRSVVTALESLGHHVDWIDHSAHATSYQALVRLKDVHHRQVMQNKFAEFLSQLTLVRIAERPPDLVLAMAQAPMTLPVLEHVRKKHFLTAMWFVENYRHLTYWQQMAAGFDFWFVIQKGGCLDAFRHAGAKEIHYLPVAADPAAHKTVSLTSDEIAEFGADVSFVGAGYANRREILPQLITPEWRLKVWGNEWDEATAIKPVLQRGGARIDTEACIKIFNATTVNLNLHSHTGKGLDPEADFVNPRTFELAACGAFQLVDHRSLLGELFTQDEMTTFRTVEELPQRIRAALHEADARRAMARAASDRVVREHTYQHRMKELLTQIGMAQPDRVGTILKGEREAAQLSRRCVDYPELLPVLKNFAATQRVELEQVAERIRQCGPMATLSREELLVLMLDEYRVQTRDLI